MHVRRFRHFRLPLLGSAATYDAAVSIPGELERARHLAFADDETAAKELLLSLMPQIEEADRDDWMLEDARPARRALPGQDGLRRCPRRRAPHPGRAWRSTRRSWRVRRRRRSSRKSTMTTTETRHLIRRYARRAGSSRPGLAAAIGDHEGAAVALDGARRRATSEFADLRRRTRLPADLRADRLRRGRCATTTCTCGRCRCGRG